MKFKIRFVDQIVGFFIILALASLVFVILMLGKSQRWFARDVSFHTLLPTAGGLSKNMAVQYKGFTIGSVKNFYLAENDNVEVIFTIFEEYSDRVRQGAMVELDASPIGLGNSFFLHAGKGDILEEGSFVPVVGSAQAMELVRQGFADEPKADEGISYIINMASSVLAQLDEALGPGSDVTEIGQIVGSLSRTVSGLEEIPPSLNELIAGLNADLAPVLENLDKLTTELNRPDGLIYTVLDTDKDVYNGLVDILTSVSAILNNLERTTDFIPGQLPQIAALLMDLRVTLQSAEDVLTALVNNPLLRGGVPGKIETGDNNTGPRNIRF